MKVCQRNTMNLMNNYSHMELTFWVNRLKEMRSITSYHRNTLCLERNEKLPMKTKLIATEIIKMFLIQWKLQPLVK
ncbi:MAG: hypothetical protein Q9221_003139 [Calogaya cf. arnoldii]